jgi:predicted RNase H-like HicB family nuclease
VLPLERPRKVQQALQEPVSHQEPEMKTASFTYWQDGDYFLGFLNDYPDYQTQGMSKEELISNLKDLLRDLQSGEIPYIRKVEKLVLAD